MTPHDVIVITKDSHPAIFAAFELISHDCGRQAGHQNYAIPMECASNLDEIEADLTTLRTEADSDFECLCIGEASESERVVKDYKLEHVDWLLQAFFEEYA